MKSTLPELISGTAELSALPLTTGQLMKLLDDISVEVDRVLAVIGQDPSLTANLLKLCNSAYYGMRRQVGSVREALIMLGNKTVVTLAFATSMGQVLQEELKAYGLGKEEMWHHALATGLGASYLMAASGRPQLKDRAFTAGLMHDMGKLLLDGLLVRGGHCFPADLKGPELLAAERQLLGFDHCEAGAALATAWNFPQMLTTAILHHHDPTAARQDTELLQAVHVANRVSESLGLGMANKQVERLSDLAQLADGGISTRAIVQLSESLTQSLEDLLLVVEEPRR